MRWPLKSLFNLIFKLSSFRNSLESELSHFSSKIRHFLFEHFLRNHKKIKLDCRCWVAGTYHLRLEGNLWIIRFEFGFFVKTAFPLFLLIHQNKDNLSNEIILKWFAKIQGPSPSFYRRDFFCLRRRWRLWDIKKQVKVVMFLLNFQWYEIKLIKTQLMCWKHLEKMILHF